MIPYAGLRMQSNWCKNGWTDEHAQKKTKARSGVLTGAGNQQHKAGGADRGQRDIFEKDGEKRHISWKMREQKYRVNDERKQNWNGESMVIYKRR